jgi:hypothetical protein
VIDISDENVARLFLFLEMAFQAKRLVALIEQSLVNGAVRRMADHTALTQCLVFVNERAALHGVTLKTSFVSGQESKAAGFERLLNIRAASFNCHPFVRIVTIGATHFAFQHRMMVRQFELRAHFEVTLETSFRRLPRIDDCTRSTAGFNMQTPRSVARFAAHVDGLLYSYAALCPTAFYHFSFCSLQSRMRGGAKVAHNLFMAGRALF